MASRDIEIKSETRHWDDARKLTKESRAKEEEQDYRYFPEPDVPAIILGSEFTSLISRSMPELPDKRKERFLANHGLSPHVAQVLIDNKELADFFESALSVHDLPREIANWVVNDLMGFVDERQKEERLMLAGLKVTPRHIAELARLVDEGTINRSIAQQVLAQIVKTGEMPSQVVSKTHTSRIDDSDELSQVIDSVFKAEQTAVQDSKSNPNAANFLLGKVMLTTKGRADPKAALELILRKLKEFS
jgi:aspartyl-tRNA(Asn)/glutamyl-tRNA(Gln) amidotransferase subunit B